MNTLRNMMSRINCISRPAYLVLKGCIIISILYLIAALLILVYAGEFSASTYKLYYLAKELYTIPQAILIIAGIGSLCIEDAAKK